MEVTTVLCSMKSCYSDKIRRNDEVETLSLEARANTQDGYKNIKKRKIKTRRQQAKVGNKDMYL